MTNDFNKKDHHPPNDILRELLADITDDKKREQITKAWYALGDMADKKIASPPPSKILQNIFHGGDEQLSDSELEMLAAAGTGIQTATTPDDLLMGKDEIDNDQKPKSDDWFFGDIKNTTLDNEAVPSTIDYDHGDDALSGSTNHETTMIDGGNNNLTGDATGDTFVFTPGDNNDTIRNFNPERDTLQFLSMSISALSVEIVDGNTLIRFGDTTITLADIELSHEQILALCKSG